MYTIIFDYKGGIYVSQLYAKDEYLACLKWAQELDTKEIEYIGERLKKKLLSELSDEDNRPLLLKERLNVWFTMITLNGNAFIHIIKTSL